MSSADQIELEGSITEVFPGGTFKVETENGHTVLAHLGGKMRKFRIRVLLGDRVIVAVSPYDLSRGRIIYRQR
jgi:translation initiation factor IF-1